MKNNIAYYRDYYGISQRQLAREVKISSAEITLIEANKRIPNVHIALRIAKFLKVSVESLFIE